MDLIEFRSLLGTLVLLAIAYALSYNRRAIAWRIVVGGTLLQIAFAFLVLKTAPGKAFFFAVNDVVVALLGFAKAGASFVFGNLVNNNLPVGTPFGGPADTMSPVDPSTVTGMAQAGAFFAFSVLPTIIFFSSFMAVLYHFGIMPKVVRFFSLIMERTLRTSGAETLSASANIFVGQTEAPLIIRPYIAKMTRSELFCVMTGGFATVAGGVMAAYVGFLLDKFPTIAGHLMAASVMSAPAALVMAKIICPEEETPETAGGAKVEIPRIDANGLDAASRGATEGMALSINVAAMLIAFIALIALGDSLLAVLPSVLCFPAHLAILPEAVSSPFAGWETALRGFWPESLKALFGICMAPLAWIMGVRWEDCRVVGELMGTKTVVNEFVAYLDLVGFLDRLSPRSSIIAIYALCGFSNFGSIGIQIGGISALCPERRHDLARIGLRAMIAGSLACFMTATIAGTIESEQSALLNNRVDAAAVSAPVPADAAADTSVARPAAGDTSASTGVN